MTRTSAIKELQINYYNVEITVDHVAKATQKIPFNNPQLTLKSVLLTYSNIRAGVRD